MLTKSNFSDSVISNRLENGTRDFDFWFWRITNVKIF
jgi:hypothetical protein